MTAPPKRKPGVSIPEAQRHTVAIKLRLSPGAAERLRELADEEGLTLAAWVTSLVGAEEGASMIRRCEIHDDDEERCHRGATVTLYRVHRHAGAHESVDCCDDHAAEVEARGAYEREPAE